MYVSEKERVRESGRVSQIGKRECVSMIERYCVSMIERESMCLYDRERVRLYDREREYVSL